MSDKRLNEHIISYSDLDKINNDLYKEIELIKEETGYNEYYNKETRHRWTLRGYLLNLKKKADANKKTVQGETAIIGCIDETAVVSKEAIEKLADGLCGIAETANHIIDNSEKIWEENTK